MLPPVSEAAARRVLAAVAARFPGYPPPPLVQRWDWYDAPWSIPWEEGPFEWAIEFSGDIPSDAFPDVYIEPHTSWALGIFPA